jgi:hypothetical protein
LKDANNIYFIFVAKWHMDGVIDDEGIDVHLEDDDEPYLDALGASQLPSAPIPQTQTQEATSYTTSIQQVGFRPPRLTHAPGALTYSEHHV